MSFEKIISIPGMSGLYKMLAQMRNGGFVVEALNDGRRVPVSATQRIIMLNDISVYTVEEDMPLRQVFLKMKENEKIAASVDSKTDPDKLKSTLKQILPEFDEERVHASDIRKMFVWFSLLNGKIDFNEPVAEEQSEGTELAEVAEPVAEVKPKKTAARKKKEAEADAPSAEDAPVKKPRAKKAAAKSE
jgi:hypothetical protein